jgi:hypothetical protein
VGVASTPASGGRRGWAGHVQRPNIAATGWATSAAHDGPCRSTSPSHPEGHRPDQRTTDRHPAPRTVRRTARHHSGVVGTPAAHPHLPAGPARQRPTGHDVAQQNHRQLVIGLPQPVGVRRSLRRPDQVLPPQRRLPYLRHRDRQRNGCLYSAGAAGAGAGKHPRVLRDPQRRADAGSPTVRRC